MASWVADVWRGALHEPSMPSSLLITAVFVVITTVAILFSVFLTGGGGARPNTVAGRAFDCFVRCGRFRNLLCSPCDRAAKRYPLANTCQIPHFKSLSDIYTFVFGYKTSGLFVEVGAFDGESFSNTSCLAGACTQCAAHSHAHPVARSHTRTHAPPPLRWQTWGGAATTWSPSPCTPTRAAAGTLPTPR